MTSEHLDAARTFLERAADGDGLADDAADQLQSLSVAIEELADPDAAQEATAGGGEAWGEDHAERVTEVRRQLRDLARQSEGVAATALDRAEHRLAAYQAARAGVDADDGGVESGATEEGGDETDAVDETDPADRPDDGESD